MSGMLRATYFPPKKAQSMREKGLAEMHDGPENLYRTNVQIAELNAFNAALAVMRFKQLRGFYTEAESLSHLLFDLADLKIVGQTDNEI